MEGPSSGAVAHPSGITQGVVDKVIARRGRLHAFESLDPMRTALIVVDLDTTSVERDLSCLDLIEPVNAIAGALRAAGGCVAWVTSLIDDTARERLARIVGAQRATMFADESRPGTPGSALCHGLDVCDHDLFATKSGFSAFFPGKCSLHEQLEQRGIDALFITGTVTNVCCESSARDATELGYDVTMVSDGCVGHGYGLHEAALATFYRIFGDVRTTADVLDLILRPTRRSSVPR